MSPHLLAELVVDIHRLYRSVLYTIVQPASSDDVLVEVVVLLERKKHLNNIAQVLLVGMIPISLTPMRFERKITGGFDYDAQFVSLPRLTPAAYAMKAAAVFISKRR